MRLVAFGLAITVTTAGPTIQHRTHHQPKPLILAAGVVTRQASAARTAHPPRATKAPRHPVNRPRRTLTVTAYCWTGNHTASGAWPRIGTAASNLYRFGQRLRVPGVGVVTITDRIGWGSELDIYMGSTGCAGRAVQFGRRELAVAVLP